jgi:hypothetical protein
MYDFEVNSTEPLDRNVEKMIFAWKARQRPSAFGRMAKRSTWIAKEWSRVFIGLTYSDPRFQGAPLMRGLLARIWAAVPGEEG